MYKIIISLLLLLTGISQAWADIPTIEREALLSLYDSTGGNNWHISTKWNGALGTECSWYGVTCTGDAGSEQHVTILNLINNNLAGILPPELADLSLLTLKLKGNRFLTGNIPPQWGKMTKLVQLSMEDCDLTGRVPPELGDMLNLQVLDISNNQLDGALPSSMGQLVNLTRLLLDNNQFDGALPNLGTLTALTDFYLSDNHFSGEIPDWFENLDKLTAMQMSHNHFSGKLPAAVTGMKSLKRIHLEHNDLTGTFPENLENSTTLTFIDVTYNKLDADSNFVALIPAALQWWFENEISYRIEKQRPLKMIPAAEREGLLSIYSDWAGKWDEWHGKPGTECFWWGVTCNPDRSHVTGLDVSVIAVSSGNRAYSIPLDIEKLLQLTELEELILASDILSSSDGYSGPGGNYHPGYVKFSKLRKLLTHLPSEGVSISLDDLMRSLGSLPVTMEDLRVFFSYTATTQWPNLGHLTNIRSLELGTRHLPDAPNIPLEIPEWLRNMQQLEALVMKGLALEGVLPEWFSELSEMITLDLSVNHLQGDLQTFLTMTRLETLILADNPLFGGVIPPELGGMTQLKILNLNNLGLSGLLPPELGYLVNLDFLSLRENNLVGSIPETYVNLTNPGFVGLSDNFLKSNAAGCPILSLAQEEWSKNYSWTFTNCNQRYSPDQLIQFATHRDNRILEGDIPVGYQVFLTKEPTADVTVKHLTVSGDSPYGPANFLKIVSGSEQVFTNNTWWKPQTIVLERPDDLAVDYKVTEYMGLYVISDDDQYSVLYPHISYEALTYEQLMQLFVFETYDNDPEVSCSSLPTNVLLDEGFSEGMWLCQGDESIRSKVVDPADFEISVNADATVRLEAPVVELRAGFRVETGGVLMLANEELK